MVKKKKKNNLININRRMALHNIDDSPRNEESLLSYLKRWWCIHYNRPYKDPLLLEYTFEELLLEYFEVLYFKNDEEKRQARIEEYVENSAEEDEEWLKEEMGDDYMSPEEMAESFKEDKDGTT